MDLLDRYLEAVKKHLPWQRQDDIVAELRANLEAQLEDKEAELGRPLSPAEAQEWLKEVGSPRQVAAGYRAPRYLIGPALYPTYRYVLLTVCFWVGIVSLIGSVVQIATGTLNGAGVLGTLLRIVVNPLISAAWVTLSFAAAEYVGARRLMKCPMPSVSSEWSPAALPPLKEGIAGLKKRRTFAHAVAEVIFGLLFLVWLLLVPQHPYLLFGPGAFYLDASPFQLAPVWVHFFWWVVALNVLQLGWRTTAVVRGTWAQPRRLESAVISLIGLVPLGMLLAVRDHVFVLLKNPAQGFASQAGNLYTINKSIYGTAVLVLVIAGASLAWELVRIGLDAYRKRVAAIR